MRDINECTAEVMRRIDEGIKKRDRRRRRIVRICAPLCVCVAVGAVTLLPPVMRSGEKGESLTGESVNGIFSETGHISEGIPVVDGVDILEQSSASVEITEKSTLSEQESARYISVHTEELYSTVKELFGSRDEIAGYPSEGIGAPFGTIDGAESEAVEELEYEIVFRTSTGGTETYTFKGKTLVNCETGEAAELTRDQLKLLSAKIADVISREGGPK